MQPRRRLVSGAFFVTWLLAGCQVVDELARQPYPCESEYDEHRCMAMAQAVLGDAAVPHDQVAAIDIVPPETPEPGMVLGGARGIQVRVTLADGSIAAARICGGSPTGPACQDEPTLRAASVTISGYRDVPCGEEPGEACATPVAPPDPEAIAASEPISVGALSVPIDHVGDYEVAVGRGSLPDGILTAASFAFADPWPLDLGIGDSVVLLDVRSLEPGGKLFDNVHLHGRFPGVERVEAVIAFRVLWFEPGATLDLRDIVVR